MRPAEIAAIVGDDADAQSIACAVEFFGIRRRRFSDLAQLAATVRNGMLENKAYAIIAPLPAFCRLGAWTETVKTARSVLAYATADFVTSTTALRSLVGRDDLSIKILDVSQTQAVVTSTMPDFTGPLQGLAFRTRVSRFSGVLFGGPPVFLVRSIAFSSSSSAPATSVVALPVAPLRPERPTR